MPRIVPFREHIPLHRLWAFSTLEEGLNLPEHAHIAHCTECTAAFRACFNAETFGAALKELNLENDRSLSSDGKPKLSFLYVITGERRSADSANFYRSPRDSAITTSGDPGPLSYPSYRTQLWGAATVNQK